MVRDGGIAHTSCPPSLPAYCSTITSRPASLKRRSRHPGVDSLSFDPVVLQYRSHAWRARLQRASVHEAPECNGACTQGRSVGASSHCCRLAAQEMSLSREASLAAQVGRDATEHRRYLRSGRLPRGSSLPVPIALVSFLPSLALLFPLAPTMRTVVYLFASSSI